MNNKPYHYVYRGLEFQAILRHLDELDAHAAMLRQQVEQVRLSDDERDEQEGLF